MRYLAIALMLVFLAPIGATAEEEEKGANPPPPPRGPGGGRGMGRGGGMLERLKQMDADGDGKITRDEFQGSDRMWDRLDRDGDGSVGIAEIEEMAARRSGRGQGRGPTTPGGRSGGLTPDQLDTDKDSKVSKKELDAWFAKADKNGDGFVDKAEWESALSGRRLHDPAPQVGTEAPKVSAKSLKTKAMVDLNAVKRTTVLIFGSHT